MGKGRAPCCDKSKVKRGPWSPQEDLTLITFIQKHGHHSWRSLPKLAGLMRCGKSCRLRWINYLRPDVKRGNFSKDEEDAIIHFHETLGNKWSKIASFLPGRTDNEIKNVWNTHLKKRLSSNSSPSSSYSSISCTHDQTAEADHNKNCVIVQEEGNSGVNESEDSPSSSHLRGKCMHTKPELREVNELHETQLLLDHDDFNDITSAFFQTNEMLFPEQPLESLLHHHETHILTEFRNTNGATQEVTKPQSFDHPQPDIPCGFEETNGEFDLCSQLVESNSPKPSPDSEEFNEWFNFIDNQTLLWSEKYVYEYRHDECWLNF